MSAPTVSAGTASSVAYVPPRTRPRLTARALRTHLGTLAGVAILAVLLWRMGTGVFLDGLRRIDAPTLLAALGIGLVTTAFSAWRWQLVARSLHIRLPLGPALADYYRALFLNAALPGGVLGDVHRAVRHGQSAGDLGRGVRSVVLERTAGQVVLAVVGLAVLLTVPSPVLAETRHIALLLMFAVVGALAIGLAVRMNRTPAARRRRALLDEAREALLSRRNGPGVIASSVVVLAGYVAMFLLAARVTGTAASVTVLLPLAVLALLAMSLPLNVGGWGPREGVTAWAFGAAGLGAANGLSVAVVYGVLSFTASLPGALALATRWYTPLKTTPNHSGSPTAASDTDGPRASAAAPDRDGPRPPSAAPVPAHPRSPSAPSPVSSEKYVPNDSARLPSNTFPFSASPSEGRPMTPESV
nr:MULTISPECIES: lysylphosphatidylglycerol synthase transmembrane domain-containing protein [Streptomyces]